MYTLRFPFELPPGQEIAGGYRGKLGHLTVEMTQRERGYLVLVEGLESEDAAKKYADTLWAALKWVLLEKKLPVQASYDLQEVIPLPDNTDKVLWGLPVKDRTAVIEEGFPAVFPSETSFFRLKINVPSGVVSFSANNVGQVLVEGLTFPHCADVLADSKLKLALELYGAYWTETSPNAKFLTLVMALEVLTPGDNRPPRVLALLDQWESELNELRRQDDLQPEESKSLASLSGSLTTFLRQNSITSEIRDLVASTLKGDGDATELATEAVRVYNKRSRLVHNGTLPEAEVASATSSALNIVERVLKAKFCLAACS